MARMAPIMVAAPHMSYFIFSMPSAGLMLMPPESKVMPLPTSPRTGAAGALARLVAHHDQARLFFRALGDAPEGSHLQFLDLVGAVDLAGEADFVAHGAGTLGEDGGSHEVAGLEGEGAGEVLRFGEDGALGDGLLDGPGVGVGRRWRG